VPSNVPLDFLPLPKFLLRLLMEAAMAEVTMAEVATAAMVAQAPGQRAMGIVMQATQPMIRASLLLLSLENLIRLAFPLIPLPTIRP